MPIHMIMAEIADELKEAESKFPAFNSPHEGYAIILEELDEMWDEIKSKEGTHQSIRKEAIQVAAMVVRMIKNCCSDK